MTREAGLLKINFEWRDRQKCTAIVTQTRSCSRWDDKKYHSKREDKKA